MKEQFREKFKSKTKEELLVIVDDRGNYQQSAIEAAIDILRSHYGISREELNKRERSTRRYTPKYARSHHLKPAYLRTFSTREFWSSLCASAVFTCLFWLYKETVGVTNDWTLSTALLTMFLMISILNHVFYAQEHRRSLSFVAGFFQLSLTSIWIILYFTLFSIPNQNSLELTDVPKFYLFMLIVGLVVEANTQFIKAIFIVFKWPTW